MRPFTVQRLLAWLLVGAVIPGTAPVAWAAPQGEQVVSGEASFSREGDLTQIRAGNNAIIDYQSFDILTNETVQFIQPSTSARVLNRIQSTDPTQIDGSLLANGRVYIVNPAGVFFGENALVDAAALYAAAGSMTNEDFLERRDRFTDLGGRVVNLGTIQADIVALLGQEVVNRGQITAHGGMIALVAGDEVVLVPLGDRLRVRVASRGGAPRPEGAAGVENSGSIDAGSGTVDLAAGDFYSLAIRQTDEGSIVANDVKIEGGYGGFVHVSGAIDASNPAPGESGGRIEILGDSVALTGASLDASGGAGDGTVLVGGDFQGKGEARNARRTYVDAGSEIRADAITEGDGGTVVVWADEATWFLGSISARGGAEGGDGGFAETSGKEGLDFRGQVDLTAAQGDTGTLLLDPENITIVAGGGTDPTTLTFDDAPLVPPTALIGDLSIETALNGANVVLKANNDIKVSEDVSASGSGNLSLEAGRSIAIDETVSVEGNFSATANDVDATASGRGPGPGSLSIGAGASISATGSVSLGIDSGGTPGTINIAGLASASPTVMSGDDQQYMGNVVLDEDTTLSAAGNITFQGRVDSATSEFNDLTVTTSGTTAFGDATGNDFIGGGGSSSSDAAKALGKLVINGDGLTVFNVAHSSATSPTVRTTRDAAAAASGGQTYGGNVRLDRDTVLVATTTAALGTAGDVTFQGRVDSQANPAPVPTDPPVGEFNDLTVTTSGTTAFGDATGNDFIGGGGSSSSDAAKALGKLVINGDGLTVFNVAHSSATSPTVRTTRDAAAAASGGQTYGGNVRLDRDTVLVATTTAALGTAGDVTFQGRVDSQANPAPVPTDPPVGEFNDLTVTTSGTTAFGDATGNDFIGGGGSSSSDAAKALGKLVINGGGLTVFNVAHSSPTVRTTRDAAAAASGGQTYGGNVRLDQDTVLVATTTAAPGTAGDITFQGRVDSQANPAPVPTDPPVGEYNDLTVTTSGTTAFGDATGNDFIGGGGSSSSDAAKALGKLIINGGGLTVFNVANSSATSPTVRTTRDAAAAASGGQTYGGNVRLDQDTALVATTTAAPGTAGDVTFQGRVDSQANPAPVPTDPPVGEYNDLTVTTSGTTAFGDATGNDFIGGGGSSSSDAAKALGKLVINGDGLTVFNVAHSSATSPTVRTTRDAAAAASGGQTYGGNVRLDQDTALVATTTAAPGTAGDVTFQGRVDSQANPAPVPTDPPVGEFNDLTVTTSGTTAFGDATGNDFIGGGGSSSSDAAKALGKLVINGDGLTVFNVAHSSATSPTVRTTRDAAAAASGGQTYGGNVRLDRDTVLVATTTAALGTAGDVTFQGRVDSQANPAPVPTDPPVGEFNDLTVTTSGTTAFGDATGNDFIGGGGSSSSDAAKALGKLVINGDGLTVFNVAHSSATSPTVRTTRDAAAAASGGQTYGGNVRLDRDTVLVATTTAALGTAGDVTFQGRVDSQANPAPVPTDPPVGEFNDLTVTTNGTTTFGDATGNDFVGGGTDATKALGSLTTNGDGLTVFNVAHSSATSPTVRTTRDAAAAASGGQTYGGNVRLDRDTVLVATTTAAPGTAGDITFQGRVDSQANPAPVPTDPPVGEFNDLTVTTNGTTTFGDATGNDFVGGGTDATKALGSLTTNGDGLTVFNVAHSSATSPTVRTTRDAAAAASGGQTYGGNVRLDQDTALVATTTAAPGTAGDVTFQGRVDSQANPAPVPTDPPVGEFNDLTVTTNGTTTFGDATGNDFVGGGTDATKALGSLTTNGDGLTVFNVAHSSATSPTVRTTRDAAAAASGGQTYGGNVRLDQDTALVATTTAAPGTAGDVTFQGRVDSQANPAPVPTDPPVGEFNDLTVTTSGTTAFGDATGNDFVGGGTDATKALGSLTTNGGGLTVFNVANSSATSPTVRTADGGISAGSGSQTYNDLVVLEQDTVLESQNIDSNTTTTPNAIAFNAAPHAVWSATGERNDLEVNTAGTTTFEGHVGVDTAAPSSLDRVLGSLTTDAVAAPTAARGGATVFDVAGSTTAAPTVRTADGGTSAGSGSQTYNDLVVLEQDTVLESQNIDSNTTTTPNAIAFNAAPHAVWSATGERNDLEVNTAGTTTFEGHVGVDTAAPSSLDRVLGSLTTDAVAAPTAARGSATVFDVAGSTTAAPTVRTADGGTSAGSGSQTYNDLVVLEQDTVLESQNIDSNTTTTPNAIAFNAAPHAVWSATGERNDLEVNTAGTTTFEGHVGVDTAAPSSLDRVLGSLTTDAVAAPTAARGSATVFDVAGSTTAAPTVRTADGGISAGSGSQTYNDLVVLEQDTVLESQNIDSNTTTTPNAIAFNAAPHAVWSATGERNDLEVNTAGGGKVTFGGDVGGTAGAELGTLTVDVGTGPNGRIEFDTNANQVVAMNDIELNKGGRSAVPTNATIFKKSGDLAITSNTGKVTFGQRDKITVGGALNIEASAAGTGGVTVPDVNAVDLELNAGTGAITVLGREPGPSENSSKDRGADIVADSITFIGNLELGGTGQTVVDVSSRSGGAAGEVSPAVLTHPFVLRTAFREGGPVTAADLVAGGTALDLTPGGAAPGSQRAPKNPIPFLLERPSGGVNAAAASERPLRESELSEFLACDPEDEACQSEVLGEARASSEEASVVQDNYTALFGPPGTRWVPAENPRRIALQRAVDAYRTQTGSPPSGVAFRQFVEKSSQYSDALKTLDLLLALFQEARALGLTGEGVGPFKDETLREIAPEGISIEALDAAVEAGALNPARPQAEAPSGSSSVAATGAAARPGPPL